VCQFVDRVAAAAHPSADFLERHTFQLRQKGGSLLLSQFRVYDAIHVVNHSVACDLFGWSWFAAGTFIPVASRVVEKLIERYISKAPSPQFRVGNANGDSRCPGFEAASSFKLIETVERLEQGVLDDIFQERGIRLSALFKRSTKSQKQHLA